MQTIVPPYTVRNPSGRGHDEILAALQGRTGSRMFTFRYQLLEADGSYVRDLDNVLDCVISQNWLADIKRTATFRLRETGNIDFLSDRIQPFIQLRLPPYGANDFVEWPQGVFLLTSPKRSVSRAGVVTREVTGYDPLQVYTDDVIYWRYHAPAGTVVTTEVKNILGSVLAPPLVNLTPSSSTLQVAKEWEPGVSKLRIINDLLSMINYESLSFDENGWAQVVPYRTPAQRGEEYVYDDGQHGLIVPDAGQLLDIYSVPNKWVLVVSEPDAAPIVSTYTNSNPASLTSTVSRLRTITDYRTEQEAASQADLDAKVARLAFAASQVYETMEFSTGLMPIHSGNDVYRISLSSLAVNALYAEQSWRMTLKAGATMEHAARRVVSV